MSKAISPEAIQQLFTEAIQQLFTEARTHHAWQAKPVEPGLLNEVYELAKWGPTSVNSRLW